MKRFSSANTAGIRIIFKVDHLNSSPFRDDKIQSYLKPFKINTCFEPFMSHVIDGYTVANITFCDRGHQCYSKYNAIQSTMYIFFLIIESM